MKNLEQIRAAAAAHVVNTQTNPAISRKHVAGLPALILSNGLLAAAAYCCEPGKGNRNELTLVFDAIARHLHDQQLTEAKTGQDLINKLAEKDSFTLQRATLESLAFLAYLKRFAKS